MLHLKFIFSKLVNMIDTSKRLQLNTVVAIAPKMYFNVKRWQSCFQRAVIICSLNFSPIILLFFRKCRIGLTQITFSHAPVMGIGSGGRGGVAPPKFSYMVQI